MLDFAVPPSNGLGRVVQSVAADYQGGEQLRPSARILHVE
jgi:hypothetical protein